MKKEYTNKQIYYGKIFNFSCRKRNTYSWAHKKLCECLRKYDNAHSTVTNHDVATKEEAFVWRPALHQYSRLASIQRAGWTGSGRGSALSSVRAITHNLRSLSNAS